MTDQEYLSRTWNYADARQQKLLDYLYEQQETVSDEVQEVLDKFKEIELSGKLSKRQVDELHRKIKRWKEEDFTDCYEMRLYLKDLGNRTRMTGQEAFFLSLFAVLLRSYRSVMERDVRLLTQVAAHVYQTAFAEARAVTGKGSPKEITRREVERVLRTTMPNGGNYYRDLSSDASYRAGLLAKQTAAALLQKRPLDIHSKEFRSIMDGARRWQLRAVERTPSGGFAGYYDMVMSFVVNEYVAQAYFDAQVTEYQFVATLDDRTTEECRSLHSKVFPMSELKMGINAPPIYPPPHPCRSMIRIVR